MKGRSRGVLLAECLLAIAVAALLLPPLASALHDALSASSALRQQEEAFRIASSCLEMTSALGDVPSIKNLSEDLGHYGASYDVSVKIVPEPKGKLCSVTVSWKGARGRKKVELERRLR